MFDTDRLPIGRAEESLAKTLGPTGGRLWICNQLRSGALAARCSTWRVQTNWWYMPDYPVEAEDYEIPSIFWRVDRARPGEHVILPQTGQSHDRLVATSDWSEGRFAEVAAWGGPKSLYHRTIIADGVTLCEAAFRSLAAHLINPASPMNRLEGQALDTAIIAFCDECLCSGIRNVDQAWAEFKSRRNFAGVPRKMLRHYWSDQKSVFKSAK